MTETDLEGGMTDVVLPSLVRYRPKDCVDCGEGFTPGNSRQLRCVPCGLNYRRGRSKRRWAAKTLDEKKSGWLRWKHGMSAEEYKRLLEKQAGRCAICAVPEAEAMGRVPGSLQVDHCHKTGRIRGLLCWNCNIGIGQFGDNPSTIKNAAEYLELAA